MKKLPIIYSVNRREMSMIYFTHLEWLMAGKYIVMKFFFYQYKQESHTNMKIYIYLHDTPLLKVIRNPIDGYPGHILCITYV